MDGLSCPTNSQSTALIGAMWRYLTRTLNYFSRGVREAINIYRHPSSLNRDKGRHQLPPVYQSILSYDRRSTRSCDNQDRQPVNQSVWQTHRQFVSKAHVSEHFITVRFYLFQYVFSLLLLLLLLFLYTAQYKKKTNTKTKNKNNNNNKNKNTKTKQNQGLFNIICVLLLTASCYPLYRCLQNAARTFMRKILFPFCTARYREKQQNTLLILMNFNFQESVRTKYCHSVVIWYSGMN